MDTLELIYTDVNLFELGIIEEYEGDFDSTDTKDFEVVLHDPVVPLDGYIFIDGTEFGGKVINRLIDSKEYTYTYTCRNFRGMLDKKVLISARTLQGDISNIINVLLVECDMTKLFVCDAAMLERGQTISSYKMPAFSSLYFVLMDLADSINANLVFEYSASDGLCHIIPTPIEDYSDYLNYNRDNTIHFTIEDTRGGVNHLICTGVEVLDDGTKKRYTIPLFTDDNGVVQKFSTVDEPTRDSHYILSEKYKTVKGIDEVVEVLDVNTITVEYDYEFVPSSKAPSDWENNYRNYYYREIDNETGEERVDEYGNYSYSQVSPTIINEYTKTAKRVIDPSTNEDVTYYEENDAAPDGYSEADIVTEKTIYKEQKFKSVPKGWAKHYDQFFIKKSDGTSDVYEAVPAKSYDDYVKLKKRPTGWGKEYGSYYMRNPDYQKSKAKLKEKYGKDKWKEHYKTRDNEYIPVKPVVINGVDLYKLLTDDNYKRKKSDKTEKAPEWKKNKYYKKITREKAPKYDDVKPVYLPSSTKTVVAFEPNKYYIANEKEIAPQWKANTYYRQYPDHYYNMVRDGLAYLLENRNQQVKKIALDELEVMIGDIVGGTEETTGLVINTDNDVRNIVVKITNGVKTDIEYTIGGNDEDAIEKGKYTLWNGTTYWDEVEEET